MVATTVRILRAIERHLGFAISPEEFDRRVGPELATSLLAAGFSSLDELSRALDMSPAEAPALAALVDAVVIGETSFYRHPEQIAAVVEIATHLGQSLRRPLELWCAGCSVGAEPFTLAMALDAADVAAHVLGSDVNPRALDHARRGDSFAETAVRNVPDEIRARYLHRVGARWTVNAALRDRVRLLEHNLVTSAPPRPEHQPQWDLILCRNVLIYFSRAQIEATVQRFARSLAPHGCLVLGPSDSLLALDVPLTRRDATGARIYSHAPAQPATPRDRPAQPAARRQESAATGVGYDEITSRIAAGAYSLAETQLRALLAGDPRNRAARLTLGNLLVRRHAFAEALTFYDVPGAQPNAESHYLAAVALYKSGRTGDAGARLRQALGCDADWWPASYLLSVLLEAKGDLLHAELELDRAIGAIKALGDGAARFESVASVVNSVHLDRDGVLQAAIDRRDRWRDAETAPSLGHGEPTNRRR